MFIVNYITESKILITVKKIPIEYAQGSSGGIQSGDTIINQVNIPLLSINVSTLHVSIINNSHPEMALHKGSIKNYIELI